MNQVHGDEHFERPAAIFSGHSQNFRKSHSSLIGRLTFREKYSNPATDGLSRPATVGRDRRGSSSPSQCRFPIPAHARGTPTGTIPSEEQGRDAVATSIDRPESLPESPRTTALGESLRSGPSPISPARPGSGTSNLHSEPGATGGAAGSRHAVTFQRKLDLAPGSLPRTFFREAATLTLPQPPTPHAIARRASLFLRGVRSLRTSRPE